MLSHIQSSPLSIWKMSFSNIEHNLGNINGIRCSLVPDTIIQSYKVETYFWTLTDALLLTSKTFVLLDMCVLPMTQIAWLRECMNLLTADNPYSSIFWYILFVFFCNDMNIWLYLFILFLWQINDFFIIILDYFISSESNYVWHLY